MKIKKATSSIGLDIGTSAVKLVELKFVKDSAELVRFDIGQARGADLAASLKKIAPPRSVGISLSGASTVVRYIDLPRMSEEELRQALKFEAQKYIPFPINEVSLDSYILKEDPSENKILVLVAAAKSDFVSQRLKLIQEAGMKAGIVDLDSIALANAFRFNYLEEDGSIIKNKTVALLNMGASMSNLNIVENGLPVLSRDIFIAGNNFTQKIQDSLGLDSNAAEELKLNTDRERLDKVAAAAESMLADLAKELRVSFDYYESRSASSVVKIFLSGGSSRFSGLKDMLTNLLSIEVECWDPLRRIYIAEADADKAKLLSGQLAVAVGLALRKPPLKRFF